jgi:hypothetical protein
MSYSPEPAYLLPPSVRDELGANHLCFFVRALFGVLKQQRGMRQFRTRGLEKVKGEYTLATLADNITKLRALMAA